MIFVRTGFKVVGEVCEYVISNMIHVSEGSFVANVHSMMHGEISHLLDEPHRVEEIELGPAKPVVLDIQKNGISVRVESLPTTLNGETADDTSITWS